MRKGGIIFGVLTVCVAIAALYFDEVLIKAASALHFDFLDNFFFIITIVSSEIIILFVLTTLFLWTEHKRRWILPLWLSLGASALVSFILKITIQRLRPFQMDFVSLIPKLQEASYSIWNYSFPSFQSMLVFCAVPILNEQFPRLKKFWIIFAILVAFSRFYFGLHFVSDVIAGGFIGYLIGMLVVKLEKENKFGRKIYNKIFRK